MTYSHSKVQGQRSVGFQDRVQQTDGGNCVTSLANAIGNSLRVPCVCWNCAGGCVDGVVGRLSAVRVHRADQVHRHERGRHRAVVFAPRRRRRRVRRTWTPAAAVVRPPAGARRRRQPHRRLHRPPRRRRKSRILFFSRPRSEGCHTMDVLSPFISVLCHSGEVNR